jgi:hypothetical protein
MSFLPNQDQNGQSPQGVTTPNPMAVGNPPPQAGGSAGAGTGATKGGGTPGGGTPTQFGSSASKLGDYLSANAPQIQGQANTISNNLNTQYGQVGNDITNAANQFGQSVAAGYTAPNQTLVDQAAANPAGFASNPSNVSGFQAQYNDQYKGPTAYEATTPYANIQNEVTNAVQGANALNTQGGLASYFGKQGSNPTQASNTLDALLIQGNPNAQKQVAQAAGQFSNLTPQFNQSVTTANAQVSPAQQAAQQAAQYAKSQIGNTATGFGDTLNQNLTKAQANQTAYNTEANQAYSQLTPIQQWLQAYQGGGGTGVSGADNPLTQYLSQTPVTMPVSGANLATPEQYQEAAALQQLIGQGYQSPLDQANVSQAGTAPAIPTATPYNLNNLVEQIGTQATNSLYGANPIQGLSTPTVNQESTAVTRGANGGFGGVSGSQAYADLMNELQTINPGAFAQLMGPAFGGSTPQPLQFPNGHKQYVLNQ